MRGFISFLFVAFLGCIPVGKESSGTNLKAQDDRLYVRYEGPADVVQFQMFQGVTQVLEEIQPGLFEAEIELPDAEKAVFSYDLIAHRQDSTGKMVAVGEVTKTGMPSYEFIGPARTQNFRKAEELRGELIDTVLASIHLEEDRMLMFYFPPAISAETPIFYFTDGSNVGEYAPWVDALIQEGSIQSVILIGVYASEEHRYEEYVNNGIPNEYFPRHEAFFLEEVMPQVEDRIPDWGGKRYLYGVSNGAAFCMYMGLNYPDLFAEVVAFSTADYITELIQPIVFKYDAYPSFYLGAGRYEDSFFQDNKRFAEKLYRRGIDLEWKEFVSGHDFFTWRYEFLEYLVRGF
jgi:enterochelin esterase-like enzyme